MPFRPQGTRYWHYDFQIRGRRFHGSCGTEDFEEAKAVEAEKRVEAKSQATASPKGIFTLGEALGTYYAEVAQHQSSARTTISQGKALVSGINPETKLHEITMAMIQRHVSSRRSEVANGTVNRELQMLGRALRHMQKIHAATIADLDLKSVEVKEAEERVRELTRDEQTRLFKHLREDLHPLVLLAMMTGARVTALTGLKWSDVDLEARIITMREKGQVTRKFPINNEVRAFLSSLPKAEDLPHSRYVLTYVNHKAKGHPRHRITPTGGIMEKWKEALVAAGIENFRFHDLRHTFATRMLRQTGNLKLVSRLLGHKQIDTTMRYAHVLDDDLRTALDDYAVTGRVPKKSPKRRTTD
ncbi:site-specific integrase [Gemmobacter sp. 24YEA27]|uniref:tyrosine-type recombinase/integrase n=1 Tax=Gemmobacter sp. 24YEA27 TaxID=3040672 RepID=UPI0024B3A38A|nr:site-specific integrase [Gemmobacter sp. 24YEA27]